MTPEELERPILSGGERLTEVVERSRGFGTKYHPQEPEQAQEELLPQVESLHDAVETMPQRHRGSRVNFQATLLPNYLAGSYFPSRFIDHLGLHYLGNRATEARYQTQTIDEIRPTKSLILAGSDSAIAAFHDFIQEDVSEDTRDLWDDLRELKEVGLVDDEEVVRSVPDEIERDSSITWEAVLHRIAGETEREIEAERDRVFDKWIAFVRDLDGAVAADYRRIADGLTFVPVSLPVESVHETVDFNPLRAIRPMPEMRPSPVQVLRAIGTDRSPDPPSEDESPRTSNRIAVFDGGIDPDDPYLRPFTNYIELSPESPDQDSVQHGTIVSNAVLHGYIDGVEELAPPSVWLDHYRVLPTPPSNDFDLELNWILDQIIDGVKDGNYKLVNLSLGPDIAIAEDDEPHRWTSELDQLAEEQNVLFVSAAGNNGEGDDALGLNRVQAPADMVNGIGVGSCDRSNDDEWERASYSAVGPGRWGARVRPTGVTFGGSTREPFVGLGRNGQMFESAGTSYSTPVASHGLAGLLAEFETNEISPHILRAFAVHFAERDDDHELRHVGFGRLQEEYSSLLDCSQNEVTVLYQGMIPREEALGVWLPVPETLPNDLRLKFRWTLCFTSEVYPSEVTDYTGSGAEATFRPHERRIRVGDGQSSKVLDYIEDEDEFLDLIREGATPSTNPMSESRGHVRYSEHQRREAGKWETVLHQEFGKLTRSVFRPRLDLSYLARRNGRLVTTEDDVLDFALLVSLRVRRDIDLYAQVREEFDVLAPVATEVELRV